jgi:hypothetical protein
VFAVRSCLCDGLALCSGAVTVTLGRVELGVVCEAAVPLRPHNNEVDRIATVEGATRLDGILTTRSPNPDIDAVPVRTPSHISTSRSVRSRPGSIDITSITGSVRCISRISASAGFEIFYVGPAG